MHAAVCHGDRTFALTDVDVTPARSGQVRIGVAYTGICGTDLHIFHGDMDARVGSPAVVGHEMSGILAEIGPGVSDWAVSDAVTVMPLDWCGSCPACTAGNWHICHRLRPEGDCGCDIVSLGEVMLRLDPGAGRIRTARSFTAWEGGGGYNVARGLRRCFELRGAVVTVTVDNEIGPLIEDLILTGGLDPGWIQWRDDDGIGRKVRNGLNFTERGFGVRGALGVFDRGHTAASQLRPGDIDWDALFGRAGVRWFHGYGAAHGALAMTTPGRHLDGHCRRGVPPRLRRRCPGPAMTQQRPRSHHR